MISRWTSYWSSQNLYRYCFGFFTTIRDGGGHSVEFHLCVNRCVKLPFDSNIHVSNHSWENTLSWRLWLQSSYETSGTQWLLTITLNPMQKLAATFISCPLGYCNSLLCGLPDTLLRKLQSVQNATARLITGTRRSDHISPVLRELHWLLIRERVKFKLLA